METFPITWVDNWKRIRLLFVTIEEKEITVHSLGWQFKLISSEPEKVADLIAHSLAGKPVGDTEDILRSLIAPHEEVENDQSV